MYDIKKQEMIEILLENCPWYEEAELKKMSVSELEEEWQEIFDLSDMFPNGIDYDAMDEEGI